MATKDAREDLRLRGGILSSSPELMRAVEQRMAGRSFAPGYDLQTPAMRSAVREEGLDYPSFELIRRAAPSRQTLQALGYPESAVGGSMYFDRMLAGMGLADRDKKMPPFDTALGAGFRTQGVSADPYAAPLPVMQKVRQDLEKRASESVGAGSAEYLTVPTIGDEVASTAVEKTPKQEDPLAPAEREPGPDANVTGVQQGDLAPKELVRKIVQATERQIDDPEPKAKKDLRSRYRENMALFKEIYGVDDDERARDKMMSLAMIGLAIAAGQSPNALTNIAQGALTGLKGMSESEAERRQEQRDLRTAALEAAMSGEAAAAGAEARAAEKAYDRETQMIVQAMKNEAKDTEVAEKFLKMTPPGRAFLEASKTIEDSISQQTGVHYDAVRDIEEDPAAVRRYINQQALQAIAPAFSPEELALVRVPLGEAAPQKADPALQKQIDQYRKQGIPDDQIRAGLVIRKIDPALYGL